MNADALEELPKQLVENTKNSPNLEVYLRNVDMPQRYHFSNNDRIASLWMIPKTGLRRFG
jgi:type I phosphodiesterase/nucleotide pyrophosphatase